MLLDFSNFVDIFGFMLMSTVVTCFFIAGYVSYFNRLWGDVFIDGSSFKFLGKRIQLMIFGCMVGLYIHSAAMFYFSEHIAMIFHDIALFLLVFPFMYIGGYSKIERIIQLLSVTWVWCNHHYGPMNVGSNLNQPHVIVALLVTVILIVISQIPKVHYMIVYKWYISLMYFFVLGTLFWKTLPKVSMGIRMDPVTAWSAISLFMIMNMMVMFFWFNKSRNGIGKQFEKDLKIDALTKAYNFSYFESESKAAFTHAIQLHKPLSVIEWDIDHFKQINDTYGHLAGNFILTQVSSIVREIFKQDAPYAKLFRTGGEEFTIIVPNERIDKVLLNLKRAWDTIEKRTFRYKSDTINVTISMGGTTLKDEDSKFEDIYTRVDKYLYQSKRNGRNQVTVEGETVYYKSSKNGVMTVLTYFLQDVMCEVDNGFRKISAELLCDKYNALSNGWTKFNNGNNIILELDILEDMIKRNKNINNISLDIKLCDIYDCNIVERIIDFVSTHQEIDELNLEMVNIEKVKDWNTFTNNINLLREAKVFIILNEVNELKDDTNTNKLLKLVSGVKFNLQSCTEKQKSSINLIRKWVNCCELNNIDFILNGIEKQEDLEISRTCGVKYLQGSFFRTQEFPALR